MKDLQHPRFGWASELRGGGALDGETVKMVSGGDADGICIREHHKEQRTIYTQATLFLALNNMPKYMAIAKTGCVHCLCHSDSAKRRQPRRKL